MNLADIMEYVDTCNKEQWELLLLYMNARNWKIVRADLDIVQVTRCKDCKYQYTHWHEDKRVKDGGYWIYSCELNDNPFDAHAVDGHPNDFCSRAERRKDNEYK